ncbi:MAG: tripartite tricarboxylate transporter TctB family protein [Burkholderiales bacterium]
MTGVVRAPRDVVAGVLFLAVGVAALAIGAEYRLGTLLSMGPGYFPRIIGVLLTALGIAVFVGGLRWQGDALDAWRLRPLVLVLGAIGLFAWCLDRYGLIVAISALIVVSCYADRDRKAGEVVLLLAILNLLAWLIFVKGLGLPITVWPEAQG